MGLSLPRRLSSAALLAGLTAILALPACGREPEVEASSIPSQGSPAPSPPPPPPAAEVKVADAVSGQPIDRTLLLDSHLLVERDVGVMTRRDGVIESLHAERGMTVKEGEPLATLERGDLLLAEQAALLDLEKEEASFQRARHLFGQEIIPKEEYEQIGLRRDSAQKTLERIRYDLSKCVIRAPFDGVVTGRFVEKGQVITEDDRKVLFQVTAMGPLLARVYVPEWALFCVREGQPAIITPMEAGGTAPLAARIRWINDVVDAASASAEVLVEVAAGPAARALRPGTSVRVRIDLTFPPGGGAVVSIPREAIDVADPSPGQMVHLRVLDGGGDVRPREAVLGFVGDRRVEVRHGITPGEKVVLN